MLTIAIPAFNRPHYLKQVLDVFETAPFNLDIFCKLTTRIVVSFDRWIEPDLSPLLDYTCIDQIIAHRARHGHTLGITRHVQWLLQHSIAQGSSHVLLLEDDCVPILNWQEMVGASLRRNDYIFALHPDCYQVRTDYTKGDIGKTNASLRTSSWGVLLSARAIKDLSCFASIEEYDWDFSLNCLLDAMGVRHNGGIQCSTVPVVKHIGVVGHHFNEKSYPSILNAVYTSAGRAYEEYKCAINLPSNTAAS